MTAPRADWIRTCAGCGVEFDIRQESSTGNGKETWHVRCWNQMRDELRANEEE